MSSLLHRFLRPLRRPHVMVIGDAMLDEYVTCDVTGLSPEDDLTFKIREKSRRSAPGGAANVAMNLATLGCDVEFFCVVGDDDAAIQLKQHLCNQSIAPTFAIDKTRPTTRKTRYVTAKGKHIIRVDTESTDLINDATEDQMLHYLKSARADLIIVSDYNKGVISPVLLSAIADTKIPYVVDPKARQFGCYGPALMITPNEREFREAFNLPSDAPFAAAAGLTSCSSMIVLITRAEAGAELWNISCNDAQCLMKFPVRAREIGDPAGCGDSLLAGLAYGLALNWTMSDSCQLAVAAGSCAVDHFGVYPVKHEDVVAELKALYGEADEN